MKKLLILLLPFYLYAVNVKLSIQDLALMVSDANQVNIILDDNVQESKQLFFSDNFTKELSLVGFEIILNSSGYMLLETDGIYYIKRKKALTNRNYKNASRKISFIAEDKIKEIADSFDLKAVYIAHNTYLIKYTRKKDLRAFDKFLKTIDTPKNVRITGELVEVNEGDLLDKGIDFNVIVNSLNRFGDLNINIFSAINNNAFINDYVKNTNRYNVNTLISYLKANDIAKTVTRPNMIISDGKKSEFKSGETLPILSTKVESLNTNTPYTTNTYTSLESGLSITCAASIDRNDINLDLSIVFNDVKSYDAENGQAITSQKSFNSPFTIEIGKNLVLAGLSKRTKVNKHIGIPIIENIPIIGQILSHDYESENFSSFILVLKAEVI
jgi:type II secretory pathway component GspD/PulD (secretin)